MRYKTKPKHFTDFEWALYLVNQLPDEVMKREYKDGKIRVSGSFTVPVESFDPLKKKEVA